MPSMAIPACMEFIFSESVPIRKNVKRHGADMHYGNKFLLFYLTSAEQNKLKKIQCKFFSIAKEHKLQNFSEKNKTYSSRSPGNFLLYYTKGLVSKGSRFLSRSTYIQNFLLQKSVIKY